MSYHHLEGLARAREAELRKLATESRSSRRPRRSGLSMVVRGGEKAAVQAIEGSGPPVFRLGAPAAPGHGAKAS
jgi:hypothetical protein